jgi:ubiquinone biosynthesis UbiH/UbiF/VisC/COQ6 family hydroxylase
MKIWERDPHAGLGFSAAQAGRAQLGWIVEHGLIAAELWARLRSLPHFTGAAIDTADFGVDCARLHLRSGDVLEARLVIAADGADSQMRALAGIDTVTWRYGQRAIVCHVVTGQAHQMTAWQRFLKTGPLAFLPLADGRSSIVWSADEAFSTELMALDDAAFCAGLAAATEGVSGAIRAATPRVAVPLQLLHARSYAAQALVLVGDAAHAIHPLAGQGVNLGLADAQALAATLVEARSARRDWSSARNLARYSRARKARNLEMLALTDALYRAFRPSLPGLRLLLGLGLEAVDRVEPLKAWLAQRAARA